MIALRHPIAVTREAREFEIEAASNNVLCRVPAECFGPIGSEMKALSAVIAALLKIYEISKAADRGMRVGGNGMFVAG